MTELIVALDCLRPLALLHGLRGAAGVTWFKVGPSAMASQEWPDLLRADGCRIFCDLKLADTSDTVRTAVRRLTCLGIASVSTFTDRATEAALEAAEGYPLQVWRVLELTDGEPIEDATSALLSAKNTGHGIICPLLVAPLVRACCGKSIPIICPGIRLGEDDDFGGHHSRATVAQAARDGIDYIVVGRPIWQSPNPASVVRAIQCGLHQI